MSSYFLVYYKINLSSCYKIEYKSNKFSILTWSSQRYKTVYISNVKSDESTIQNIQGKHIKYRIHRVFKHKMAYIERVI